MKIIAGIAGNGLSNRDERLEGLLNDALQSQGVLGIGLVTRTGEQVWTRGAARVSPGLFTPLVAAMAGAGDFAMAELDRGAEVHVIAETDHTQIHVDGVGCDLLLVTVCDHARTVDEVQALLQDVRERLRETLAKSM